MRKRVTTQELHAEIEQIKNNHLAHLHKCTHDLWKDVKDNRKYFEQRLDRLDNRIFWVLGLTVSTLVAIIGVMITP